MKLSAGLHAIPVKGGDLAVDVLPGTTEPVLAIHGISSQRRLWNWVRADDPDITIIAPDLRGRAGSFTVEGPSSMSQHADDMIAVLDAFELDQVVVCGMSMGGYVGVNLASRYPSRVRSLVLVDGGFPLAQPAGLTPEALPVVFADRLGRLAHSWGSLDDYLAFFTSNTAPLLDPADPLLRHYLELDLRDGLVQLSGDALLEDAEDVFFGDNPWESLTVPVRFLHAQWSGGADTPPGYPLDAVERYRPKTVAVQYIEGVDHAGSIMSPTGAHATAAMIRDALA